MPLNLAGTFPDTLYARISPNPLQREVLHQSHPAMYLDSLIGNKGQHLSGVQFGHRIIGVSGRSLVGLPGRL